MTAKVPCRLRVAAMLMWLVAAVLQSQNALSYWALRRFVDRYERTPGRAEVAHVVESSLPASYLFMGVYAVVGLVVGLLVSAFALLVWRGRLTAWWSALWLPVVATCCGYGGLANPLVMNGDTDFAYLILHWVPWWYEAVQVALLALLAVVSAPVPLLMYRRTTAPRGPRWTGGSPPWC